MRDVTPSARWIVQRAFAEKWRVFALSTALALAIAASSVAFAWLSGQLIVAITEAGRERWVMLGLALLAVAIARGALQYFRTWLSESLIQDLSHRLRRVLFEHVLRASHDGALSSDDFAQRIGPDVQRSEAMLHAALANLPLQVLTGLGVGGYAFYLDWPAALMASSAAAVLLVAITVLSRHNRDAHRLAWDRQSELATLTAGTARGAELLRSYAATNWAEARFSEASAQAQKAMIKAARLRGITGPVVTIGAVLAALAVLFAVGARFESGHLRPAEAGSIAIALLLFLRPIQAGAMSAPTLSAGFAALDRLGDILSLPIRVIASEAPRIPADAELEGLDLKVAVEDGTVLLADASLRVPAGQTVAIVGPSGAGKSTLLRALSQQAQLAAGTLLVGGKRLDDATALFSVVPERPVLFRASLADNIALGAPSDVDRLQSVLDEVGMKARIEALPDGLTHVLERAGEEFSAGERQRICIARALYRDAPFLMLDEPTSHLDPNAAEALVHTLQRLLKGRTVVLVTHDERLVRAADIVVVVQEGRIVAQGPRHRAVQSAQYRDVFGGSEVRSDVKRSVVHSLLLACGLLLHATVTSAQAPSEPAPSEPASTEPASSPTALELLDAESSGPAAALFQKRASLAELVSAWPSLSTRARVRALRIAKLHRDTETRDALLGLACAEPSEEVRETCVEIAGRDRGSTMIDALTIASGFDDTTGDRAARLVAMRGTPASLRPLCRLLAAAPLRPSLAAAAAKIYWRAVQAGQDTKALTESTEPAMNVPAARLRFVLSLAKQRPENTADPANSLSLAITKTQSNPDFEHRYLLLKAAAELSHDAHDVDAWVRAHEDDDLWMLRHAALEAQFARTPTSENHQLDRILQQTLSDASPRVRLLGFEQMQHLASIAASERLKLARNAVQQEAWPLVRAEVARVFSSLGAYDETARLLGDRARRVRAEAMRQLAPAPTKLQVAAVEHVLRREHEWSDVQISALEIAQRYCLPVQPALRSFIVREDARADQLRSQDALIKALAVLRLLSDEAAFESLTKDLRSSAARSAAAIAQSPAPSSDLADCRAKP